MTPMDSSKAKNLQSIRFNLHRLRFTPYKGLIEKHNSKSIIKAVFGYLNTELTNGRGHLINRTANRKTEEPRELFMTYAFTELKSSRILGTIALLRSGRLPQIKPAEKFTLIPMDKNQGEIAEQTHFFIDYSKSDCIICIEYNNNGPRLSDLEFYLRNVASDKLELARATTVETFMDSSLDDAIDSLVNVLNFDIKLQPQKLNNLETEMQGYFTGMRNFAKDLKPKFLKVEASFQHQNRLLGRKEENKEANKMIKYLLNKFKSKPENLESFDDFVIKFENKLGHEEILNLLKGKKEFFKDVDLTTLKKVKDWYNLIESDLDIFVESL